MNPQPRILVMGAGGIGGIVAATLTEVGSAVTAVSTNDTIRAAVDAKGFHLIDEGEPRVVRGWIAAEPEGKYDLCILATQPPNVEQAARTAASHLDPQGEVVVLQNGLCEERVAAIVGANRVIGGIVAWGASMPQPGHYERTASGGFSLGRFSGEIDDAVRRVGELLEAVGPVTLTTNLRGARWSKLALNCAVSALGTIAGERLGPLVRVRRYRRLALDIMTEVVEVARAEDIKLEKIAGTIDLDWIALTDSEKRAAMSMSLTTKHALLLAVGLRYRRMRSSMLAAIERGRTPAIDFLNGEVVTRGQRRGIATPVNAAIVELVHEIARGKHRSSRTLLDKLCSPDERESSPQIAS
ncbi:MAG: ketopantoate reductase family protein [Kofleriaceae bacterium]